MKRLIRTIQLPLAAMVLMLSVFSLSTAPASAHTTEVSQGEDYAVTSASHKSGYVCDREADGHAVGAEWYSATTGQIIGYASDTTDAGCSARITFDNGSPAAQVRVCEIGTGEEWCTKKHWT